MNRNGPLRGFLRSLGRICCWMGILAISIHPGFGQLPQLAHFIAPSYPPLARQGLIMGHVTVNVTVDKTGTVTKVEEAPNANPILVGEARKCVQEWRFEPLVREQPVIVVFYFGFSGDIRESNPRTTLKVDFRGSSINIYVTTDPPPNVHVN